MPGVSAVPVLTHPQGAEPGRPAVPVALLGEALVDQYPDGSAVAGGAPFNVARWLAAFGVPALLVSRTGASDAAAGLVRSEMQRFGLSQRAVQVDTAEPTGVVQVLPDTTPGAGGHRFHIAPRSAWDFIDADLAAPHLRAVDPGWVCFGTLALRHATSRASITRLVGDSAAMRLVDLNLRPLDGLQALCEQALHLADWVKVNEAELHSLLQWFVCARGDIPAFGSDAHAHAWQQLSSRFGVTRWLLTRGEQGWASADAQGRIDASGAGVPVDRVVDTVGAGDAFTATVLAGQAHGWPLARSLQSANALAAAVCGWRGALPGDEHSIAHWRQQLGFAVPAP